MGAGTTKLVPAKVSHICNEIAVLCSLSSWFLCGVKKRDGADEIT